MSSKRKISAVLLCTFVISLAYGCVSSHLINMWHNAAFQPSSLSKILVVYVTKNAAQRRIWEDAFTGALAEHTLSAVSSCGLFPGGPPDTSQIMEVVKTNGFNGMVVILEGKPVSNMRYIRGFSTIEQTVHEIQQRKRNSTFSDEMQHPEHYSYWQKYSTCCRQIDHQKYSDTQSVGQHTINVTTTGKNARLIWSATSRTPDPVSNSFVQGEIAAQVIHELLKQHIIGFEK